MIHARNVSLSFREQILFSHLTCDLRKQDKIGLVGRNGSGKSTFLKVLAGQQSLDSGAIEKSAGYNLAYMPQEVVFQSTKTVFQEAFLGFAEIVRLQEESVKIEKILENSPEPDIALFARYSTIKDRLNDLDIAQAKTETLRVLKGLGFKDDQLEQPVGALSVGWKMRLILAQLLLQKADFYLFDEPTNHLDIFAKEWFLNFLRKSNFGFLIVCHERYFLDQVCNQVLELENGKGTLYKGNYSSYEAQKEHHKEALLGAYTRQQKELTRKKATIERFRASATKAKMAQSMMKSLEKTELIEIESESRTVKFSFKDVIQSGREVLKVDKVRQSFENKQIFENITFAIERGEKVALVAANGVGKTTLFNLISEKYPLQGGKITLGYNVTSAVFDQDQSVVLNPKNTVLEEVERAVPLQTTQMVRSILGAFLFGANDIAKKTAVLSGGEKNRVSIVKVLLQNANFLMLDEPTNHLDIQSKEVLLRALKDYKGTILFVSHDHDFINDLATRVLELTPTAIYSYSGNYESYLYQKQEAQKLQETPTPSLVKGSVDQEAPKEIPHKELFEVRKKSRKVEDKIERIEKEVKELQTRLEKFDYGTPSFNEIYNKLLELDKQHKQQLGQWEELQKLLA